MLDYQASSFSLGPKYGNVSSGAIELDVEEQSLTAEAINARMDALRRDIDQRVSWANADLQTFASAAEQAIRSAYIARRERILNDRSVADALGIPVQVSGQARQPVPALRRHVSIGQRQRQAAYVPEPVLDEAIYREILDAVQSWARSLERTPKTAEGLDEEELRDLLLGTLNGYWRGAAGGELFNGSGKTDILIRADDRNVFIAECKIWRGAKGATDAIDQLLGYMVWRDSKAAMVMFIRTVDPAMTITRLHSAVKAHPKYLLTKDDADPSKQVDYVLTADDEGRRISLAVLPVVVRSA